MEPTHNSIKRSVLAKAVLLLLIVEVVGSLVAPLVLPGHVYMRWYLADEARTSIQEFLRGEALLVPDSVTGWKSATSADRGNWQTDASGARRRSTSGAPMDSVTVLAIGSSMINGGTGIRGDETLTAFMEEGGVTTANHGTMMYGLDQAALTYWSRLADHQAEVLLVGLDADVSDGLVNTFVPLRRPSEHNVAFVKPRFALDDGSLSLVRAPSALLSDFGALERHTGDHDGYDWRLSLFKSGRTPVLGLLSNSLRRARSLRSRYQPNPEGEALVSAVLDSLHASAQARGAAVLVLAMPPGLGDLRPSLPYEPDRYGERVARLRAAGMRVLDSRELIVSDSLRPGVLYGPDRGHLSARGNELLASHILDTIGVMRSRR